jgi:Domain of unknown function (DUF4157)
LCRAVGARAVTVGCHILFGANEYRPEKLSGLLLIAHELVHVAQQSRHVRVEARRFGDPHDIWETAAADIADKVIRGLPLSSDAEALTAPTGLVQFHQDTPCPGPPKWIPIADHRQLEVWLDANQAIERAYKESHHGDLVVVGSDFRKLGYLQGPDLRKSINIELHLGRKPSGNEEAAFADNLLNELRGLEKQLQPDIVNFTRREFYEIKPLPYATRNVAKSVNQLSHYYALANAIATKYGVQDWFPDTPSWYPNHVLVVSDPNRLVCTSATSYIYNQRNLHMPGLILYQVLQRGR